MPKTDATLPSGADTTRVKIALLALLLAWGALLAWTLANAQTLTRPATTLFADNAPALESLPEMESGLQFSPGSSALSASLRESLDGVFETLSPYPDTAVDIVVTGNEHEGAVGELLLARARARAVVDHLVSLGLERGRFELDIGVGDGLPPGEHRVRVRLEDDLR